MITHSSKSISQAGASTIVTVVIAGLSVFAAAFAGLAIWAYVNYADQKNNVDAKVSTAVATAEKEQADELEKKFTEREKEPNRSFAGPSDYGSLNFKYPKTWSVYVASDGSSSGRAFEAYLNPAIVPPLSAEASRYALYVKISNQQYESAIKEMQAKVAKGDLTTSAIKINDQNGTRLDGKFSTDIRGAAVIFKIRDKTLTIQTEADTFKPDFENIIKTITFIE